VAGNGSLITIAGGVTFSTAAYFYGSRAPPLALMLSLSSSLVFDASTNTTFVGDAYNNRLRAFYPNATSSVVMGPTSHPPAVNGLPGAQLQLDSPFSVAVEPRSGAILVADRFALRWFSAAGVLNATVSGGQGNYNWVSTWGFPGRISRVFFPPYSRGMAPDFEGGYFYVHSAGNKTSNIHRVDGSTGATTVYAGSSALSCGGSLAPAPRLSTGFNAIAGLARDPASRTLYVAEAGACVIRAISPAGVASIFAGTCGNCTPGGLGDGGLARDATFGALLSVAVDAAGNVYAAEFPSRVRVISATTGIIRTYAGVGVEGFSGDGGPAGLARLSLERNLPSGMSFDSCDNLFIADTLCV
jgi:DNA-binding beta-propeller fold protein YncE